MHSPAAMCGLAELKRVSICSCEISCGHGISEKWQRPFCTGYLRRLKEYPSALVKSRANVGSLKNGSGLCVRDIYTGKKSIHLVLLTVEPDAPLPPWRCAVSCVALYGLPSFTRTLSCPLGGARIAFLFLLSLFLF